MNPLELSEQEQIRRGSMAALREMGIEPYPAPEYTVTGHSDEIKASFADDAPVREVSVAGRIMSRRIMGKASFVELQDSKGRIQVSPAMKYAPTKTKTSTTLYSRSCSTSATSSA